MFRSLAVFLTLCALAYSSPAMARCSVPGNVAEIQAEAIRLTNGERQRRGLRPLAPSPALNSIAQAHSCDMAMNGVRSHTGTGGATFMRRYTSGGGCGPGGENIAWGQRSVATTITTWMNSRGHRANILNRQATEIGIGVAISDGRPNWVMVVGKGC